MYEMTLKDEWDRLDSETRQWLLDNPGCVMVPAPSPPRSGKIPRRRSKSTGTAQMLLSREDLDFIREKGTGAGAGQNSRGLRFFDTTQPGKRG